VTALRAGRELIKRKGFERIRSFKAFCIEKVKADGNVAGLASPPAFHFPFVDVFGFLSR
jgi:hypothetical protein